MEYHNMETLQFNDIYNIDCVEGMKKLPDNSVDLIVTSPPYNVGVDYDSYDDRRPWDEYLSWCEEWLKECYRVLKDDGRLCVNHCLNLCSNNAEGTCKFPLFDIRDIEDRIGFHTHKIAVWTDITQNKFTAWGSWLSASSPNIMQPYEGILISYKNQWNKINKGKSTINKETFMMGVTGIWNLGTTTSKTKASFPESLPEMCIRLLSYEGDTVMDPFSGSGTTCYVAKKLKRNFIGFEISPNYTKIAKERLNTVTFTDELWGEENE